LRILDIFAEKCAKIEYFAKIEVYLAKIAKKCAKMNIFAKKNYVFGKKCEKIVVFEKIGHFWEKMCKNRMFCQN